MRIGFAKVDITPRVGVELCGFGPFLNRHSIAVRDRLWSRAMAVELDGQTLVIVSNDLIQLNRASGIPARVREIVRRETGLPDEAIMLHCTHTHSGPSTRSINGWGETDIPYLEILPQRIADACIEAVAHLQEATLSHAEVPCEGVGLNREYDQDAPPLEEVLREDWRPAMPELTDTTCHVLAARTGDQLIGFASYFGCHPVVCCRQTRYIHGDFVGVATNLLEREHPGSVGLFLQGAQGDVNSCVVHKPEQEALLALDIIADRYARSVRRGLRAAQPVHVDSLSATRHEVTFSRKPYTLEQLRRLLDEQEAILHAPDASDTDRTVRMAAVYAIAFRRLIAMKEAGQSLEPPTELHGFRIGPIALLGTPFEIFQAIKNDVRQRVDIPIPLVMGLTNDALGYAPDNTAAARGGYAADMVPLMLGSLPFSNIHNDLVEALQKMAQSLAGNPMQRED